MTLEEQVEKARVGMRVSKREQVVSHLDLARTRLVERLGFETEPGIRVRILGTLEGVDEALREVKP